MKTIDNTPLLDEKGNLGFSQRIQGMLKFGFNWPNELQAQKAIITFFDRNLEKGYTLIRNQTLGQSGIMIPMILVGPAGLYVINLAYAKGRYEAKGDSWNVASGNQYKPASVNLIQVTTRMARALQKFIERQGMKLPVAVEPVLIAADPGLHIDSVRPSIKVIMIDGVKSFVSTLAIAAPALRGDAVLDLVERIVNPRPPKEKTTPPPAPAPTPQPRAAWEEDAQPEPQNVSRARAIFNSSEEASPFNPADFGFAMEDEPSAARFDQPIRREAVNEEGEGKPVSRRVFGMTQPQLAVIIALALCLVCIVVAAFAFVIPSLS